MRCLCERIARMANHEELTRGCFWEGRYKCVLLADDSAVLACLAYVDLNPIRAQIAETPETSRFTSVFERIRALDAQSVVEVAETVANPPEPAHADAATDTQPSTQPVEEPPGAAWLSPFELSEIETAEPVPADRASNKGCLPMSFAEYLQLLDWTGRQIRDDKRGAIPADLAPILARLKVSDDGWLLLMRGFNRMFRRAAGRPQSLQRERDERGCQLMQGIRHSRAIFL